MKYMETPQLCFYVNFLNHFLFCQSQKTYTLVYYANSKMRFYDTYFSHIRVSFTFTIYYHMTTITILYLLSNYIAVFYSQCGNYGNSLSHFLDKNFVKVTFLVKQRVDLTKTFFGDSKLCYYVLRNIFFVKP